MKALAARLAYLSDEIFLNKLNGYANRTVKIGAQNLPFVLVINDGQSGHINYVILAIILLTFHYKLYLLVLNKLLL